MLAIIIIFLTKPALESQIIEDFKILRNVTKFILFILFSEVEQTFWNIKFIKKV
jgi:hypothetical protein